MDRLLKSKTEMGQESCYIAQEERYCFHTPSSILNSSRHEHIHPIPAGVVYGSDETNLLLFHADLAHEIWFILI
jgi:hypothetical protein